MKTTVTAFVFMSETYPDVYTPGEPFEKSWVPKLRSYKSEDCEDSIFLHEMSVEIEAPDDFDPIPKQTAALEQLKRDALDEYQCRVAEINERLSKLQALTYEPSEVSL